MSAGKQYVVIGMGIFLIAYVVTQSFWKAATMSIFSTASGMIYDYLKENRPCLN